MKKIYALFLGLVLLTLVGCSNKTISSLIDNLPTGQTVELSNNQSMVLSTYLASGLLNSTEGSNSNQNMSFDVNGVKASFLSTVDEELEIETVLDEVNVYFDQLKAFIDGGIESVLTISEQPSTLAGYDYEITYTIDGLVYTIYYSYIDEVNEETPEDTTTTTATNMSNDVDEEEKDEEEKDEEEKDEEETDEEETDEEETDEETDEEETDEEETDEEEFQLEGLMIIDGVEYQLIGENKIEDNEQKMWFKTIDLNNTGNEVKVEIKNEEGEQKFEIHTVIDNVEKTSEIKFENEENETKVELTIENGEEESSYEFKKEVEDNTTVYKFQYEVNGVEGEVKVFEVVDELGNVTYRYDIEEDGERKEVEKESRKHDDDDEEDDDEVEDESDEEEADEESEVTTEQNV